MIDFGFSKQYIDPHTRRHIPDSKVKRDFIGNYWFRLVHHNNLRIIFSK
jgi:casein kinase 1